MDDVKKVYREGEQQVKEAVRKIDGDEDVKDKVGNAGDEVRKGLGNAGDDMRKAGDEMTRDTEQHEADWTEEKTPSARPA